MPSKTMLIVRVKPREIEDTDLVARKIREIKTGDVKDVRKEPIGFGVEIIKAGIVVPSEDESLPNKVVEELMRIPEVEEAEIVGMTLL